MSGVEFDPYQGRRRAHVRSLGDRWILPGVVLLAMVALVALVVIVVNGPQRPRSAPPGMFGVVAAPSMVGASPTDPVSGTPMSGASMSGAPVSATPTPSPGASAPSGAAPGAPGGTGAVRRQPRPTPVTMHPSPAPWT